MARRLQVREIIDSPDNWNSVVLSLATGGGIVVSDNKMAEIRVCAPKFNKDTLLIESVFLTYWIEKKKLHELYQCVMEQQEELNLHNEDKEEQERITKEREESLLSLKKMKNKKKNNKIIIEEPEPLVDEEPDEHEHEVQ